MLEPPTSSSMLPSFVNSLITIWKIDLFISDLLVRDGDFPVRYVAGLTRGYSLNPQMMVKYR